MTQHIEKMSLQYKTELINISFQEFAEGELVMIHLNKQGHCNKLQPKNYGPFSYF